MFCSYEFALSNSVIVLFASIVVSMKINRRHYFRSDLRSNNSGVASIFILSKKIVSVKVM